jgi:hypothetical protein
VTEGTGGYSADDFGQNKKPAVARDIPAFSDEINVGGQEFVSAAAAVDGVGGGGGYGEDVDDDGGGGDYYI